MRIAATGEFGAITWEMNQETIKRYREAVAGVKEVLGEQVGDDFEHAFVKQVQGIFAMAALHAKSAICVPHLTLIMLSMLINGMKTTNEASIGLIETEKRKAGQ